MKTIDLMAGLHTLLPYYDNVDGYHTSAEHDVLSTYPTDRPLSEDDVQRMLDLGWFQEDSEWEDSDEMKATDYKTDESWACFT